MSAPPIGSVMLTPRMSAIKKSANFLGTPSAADKTRSDEFGAGLVQARAAILGMGIKK